MISAGRPGIRKNKWSCSICDGQGHSKCSKCSGSSFSTCLSCNGSGKLKLDILLTISFDTEVDEFLKKSENGIPDEEIKNCQSISVYLEENSKVRCSLKKVKFH